MPVPDGSTTPAADGAAPAGKGNEGGTKPDSHLEEIRKQLAGVQSLLGRFGNDLGTLRKRVESTAGRPGVQTGFANVLPEDEADPVVAELTAVRADLDEARRERDLDRFMRISGVTTEDWEAITQRLAANEAQHHRFVRGSKGEARLDYFTSYNDVWKDIQLERYNAARAEGDKQRAEQDRQRETSKQQGSVSGAGAVSTEGSETLDISKMSSAEFLQKVLIPAGAVDPNDMPSTKPYGG